MGELDKLVKAAEARRVSAASFVEKAVGLGLPQAEALSLLRGLGLTVAPSGRRRPRRRAALQSARQLRVIQSDSRSTSTPSPPVPAKRVPRPRRPRRNRRAQPSLSPSPSSPPAGSPLPPDPPSSAATGQPAVPESPDQTPELVDQSGMGSKPPDIDGNSPESRSEGSTSEDDRSGSEDDGSDSEDDGSDSEDDSSGDSETAESGSSAPSLSSSPTYSSSPSPSPPPPRSRRGRPSPVAKATSQSRSQVASKPATLTSKQLDELLLAYLREQNRPYNVVTLLSNIGQPLKRPLVQRSLDRLVAASKLSTKAFNKLHVYWYNQSQWPPVTDEKLAKLKADEHTVTREGAALGGKLRQTKAECARLEAEPTTSQLRSQGSELKQRAQSLRRTIQPAMDGSLVLDPSLNQKRLETLQKVRKLWKVRQRMCMDALATYGEHTGTHPKVMIERCELETDEDAGVNFQAPLKHTIAGRPPTA